jgi:hypothetical protein
MQYSFFLTTNDLCDQKTAPLTPKSFIYNRQPYSQAGPRGFDPAGNANELRSSIGRNRYGVTIDVSRSLKLGPIYFRMRSRADVSVPLSSAFATKQFETHPSWGAILKVWVLKCLSLRFLLHLQSSNVPMFGTVHEGSPLTALPSTLPR